MSRRPILYSLLRWFFLGLVLLNLSLPVLAAAEIWRQSAAPALTTAVEGALPVGLTLDPALGAERTRIITDVLATLSLPYDRLGAFAVSPAPPNASGCAYTDAATRTIYLGETCGSHLAYVFTHELGHIVDAALLTDAKRRHYCERRGIDRCDRWYDATYALADGNDDRAWQASPAEDFAEEFVRRYLDADYPNHTAFAGDGIGDDFWQGIFPGL